MPRSDSSPATSRARKRSIRSILLGLIGLGIVLAAVAAFRPRPVAVDLATATVGPLRVTVDDEGKSRIRDRYVISAPIGGIVERVRHRPGDEVVQGEVLVRIIPALPALLDERARLSAESRLASAQASAARARVQVDRTVADRDLAEAQAERARRLHRAGELSAEELQIAEVDARSAVAELASQRLAVRIADHEVEMARATLQVLSRGGKASSPAFEIPAPLSGRVLAVLRESEGVVQPGEPLLEVGDPAALEVVVDVLTTAAVRIRPGAEVVVDRWGGDPLAGRVRLVEPSAFTRVSALGVEEQRVNVVVDLTSPRPLWEALGDGYRIEARIVVWEAAAVLRLPASAVFRRADAWTTFAVDDGVVEEASLEIGHRTGSEVEVVAGIDEGTRVVLYPSDRVAAGVKVVSR